MTAPNREIEAGRTVPRNETFQVVDGTRSPFLLWRGMGAGINEDGGGAGSGVLQDVGGTE